MDRFETTQFFCPVQSAQTELEHSNSVGIAFLKWSRCSLLASRVTCWALQTLRGILSCIVRYVQMLKYFKMAVTFSIKAVLAWPFPCIPYWTEADCVISLGHRQWQPRALRLGQVRGWGVRDPGGRGVWEWAAPGGVSTGLALPWAHRALVGACAATASTGSAVVGWTFGLDSGARGPGQLLPTAGVE